MSATHMLLGESVFSTLSGEQDFTSVDASIVKLSMSDMLFDSGDASTSVAAPATGVPESMTIEGTVAPLQVHSSLMDSVFDLDAEIASASPMFSHEASNGEQAESWESLFADDEIDGMVSAASAATQAPAVTNALEPRSFSTSAVPSAPVDFESSISFAPLPARSFSTTAVASSGATKRSFSTASSESPSTSAKVDNLGVTPYKRKQRATPLSPVVAKADDTVSVKRARNTEAARRSRARKMERMTQLEDKCEDLIKENESLKDEVQRLRQLLGLN